MKMGREKRTKEGGNLLRWLVGLSLLGGALGYRYWCPQGAQAVQLAVFGQNGDQIAAAFAAFEDEYAEDGNFTEAVEAFLPAP